MSGWYGIRSQRGGSVCRNANAAGFRSEVAARVAVFLVLLLAPVSSLAIQYGSGTKVFAEDGTRFDGFASSVDGSGSFVLVGAPGYSSNAGAAFVFDIGAPAGVVEHTLIPADNAGSDSFGFSIAISGNTAVVGAPYDDDNGSNSGSAYVFVHDGENWVEDDKLTASDGVPYDAFGYDVDIDGDTILVGSPASGFGRDDPGAAYVYRYDGANWVEEDKISASDGTANNAFGSIVALSGDTAVVGVPDNDAANDLGKVYVYRYNGASSWNEEAMLLVPDDTAQVPFGASFGESIAVQGDSILVGAYRGFDADGNRVGTVYAYRYNGIDTWVREAKLAPAIPAPTYNYLQHFGRSIALQDDVALIGARGGVLSSYLGAAHVFFYDGVEWVEQDTITTSDPSAGDRFGESVGLAGSTALVADVRSDGRDEDSGAVYLFDPVPDATLTAFDGEQYDEFGRSVAISGDTALVGAPGEDDGGSRAGAAYFFWYDGLNWLDDDKFPGGTDEAFGTSVALEGDTAVVGAAGGETEAGALVVYDYVGDAWTQNVRLTPNDSMLDDEFGAAVAISGNRIVAGAPATELNDANGAAYVFVENAGSWGQEAKLIASDGEAGDEFGSSVSISGDTIVVGAHYDDDRGLDAGAAYVFEFDGANWTFKEKLAPAGVEADDEFGCAVANSADRIVVGAKRDGDNGNDAGAAYLFRYQGDSWVPETKLTASDGAPTDRFGISVAISSDDTVAIGAEYDDQKGSAYVFYRSGAHWVEEPKLLAPVRGNDYFGASISISQDVVLVGAPFADGDGDDNGAAFVSSVEYVNVPEPSAAACLLTALTVLALTRARKRCASEQASGRSTKSEADA